MRSYRTISPLPVPLRAIGGIFLLHFPSARAAQALPGTVPCGARTFLDAPQGDTATAWPTPPAPMLRGLGSAGPIARPPAFRWSTGPATSSRDPGRRTGLHVTLISENETKQGVVDKPLTSL